MADLFQQLSYTWMFDFLFQDWSGGGGGGYFFYGGFTQRLSHCVLFLSRPCLGRQSCICGMDVQLNLKSVLGQSLVAGTV